jgi:hypothetical protein
MASRGRPKAELVLTEEERETLSRWARRRTSAQAPALRALVLGCAEGLSNTEVAARARVAQPTVGKWQSRFVEARCDRLVDDPRPGRPTSVTDEQVEDVVVATLESTPPTPGTGRARRWPSAAGCRAHDRADLESL